MSTERQNNSPEIMRYVDIRYYRHRRCKLDVYVTNIDEVRSEVRSEAKPVVVVVHGGAWAFQSKDSSVNMSTSLALRNFCVVAPSYTLSNLWDSTEIPIFCTALVSAVVVKAFFRSKKNGGFLRVCVVVMVAVTLSWLIRKTWSSSHIRHATDVSQAILWVQRNIHFYGGDPSNMFILGHSAGAHIAALIATNKSYLGRLKLGPEVVKGVIGISGPYNDYRLWQVPLGSPLFYTVFGFRQNYHKYFPIYEVQDRCPPHLLICAERDYTLINHASDYQKRLVECNISVESYILTDSNHLTVRMHREEKHSPVLLVIVNFIKKNIVSPVQKYPSDRTPLTPT